MNGSETGDEEWFYKNNILACGIICYTSSFLLLILPTIIIIIIIIRLITHVNSRILKNRKCGLAMQLLTIMKVSLRPLHSHAYFQVTGKWHSYTHASLSDFSGLHVLVYWRGVAHGRQGRLLCASCIHYVALPDEATVNRLPSVAVHLPWLHRAPVQLIPFRWGRGAVCTVRTGRGVFAPLAGHHAATIGWLVWTTSFIIFPVAGRSKVLFGDPFHKRMDNWLIDWLIDCFTTHQHTQAISAKKGC